MTALKKTKRRAIDISKAGRRKVALRRFHAYNRNHTFLSRSRESFIISSIETYLRKQKRVKSEVASLLNEGKVAVITIPGLKKGEMLKIYPDKRKEIIRLDDAFNEIVIKRL